MKRRVVITGLGAITPIGNTVDEFWEGIKEGRCGIGAITKFDTSDYKVKIAAEVKGTLRDWIKVYNDGGDPGSVKHSGGGSYMKQGRETTQAERIEIAKACITSGKNYGEIALKYQVSYQQARS